MSDTTSFPQNNTITSESPLAWRFTLARRLFQTITVISLPGFLASTYYAVDEGTFTYIPIYLGLLIFMLTVAFWKRVSDKVRIWGLLALVYFIVLLDFYTEGRGSLARSFMIVFAFMGATFFGRRGAIVTGSISLLTMVTFAYLFTTGALPDYQVNSTTVSGWISNTVIVVSLLSLVIFSVDYLIREMTAYLNRSNELNRIIEAERALLERRVEERTRALTTSTEVSRRLSTILDLNQLVKEVVEQVKNSFNYYHAHIYLMDEYGKELLMAGGTGDAGQVMLARGHKIPVGKGLVGLAAETGEMIRVSDTTEDPDWLPNPLLPETKSEVAVPIVLGKKVLGVLDVQHNVQDGLSEEDAVLLQSVAYQVAVAVRNAQVFSEAQQQAERETLINEIGRKIQNTVSVEQALQVAAREIGQALGARDSHAVIDLHGTLTTKAK